MRTLVNRIAGRLSGTNRDDLTTAEKQIVNMLVESGHLEAVGYGDFIDQDHSDFKGDPEPSISSKFVKTITVQDVDTGLDVEVEIRKMETGLTVGFDSSYLDQLGPGENPCSPYDDHATVIVPDNETITRDEQ